MMTGRLLCTVFLGQLEVKAFEMGHEQVTRCIRPVAHVAQVHSGRLVYGASVRVQGARV